MKERLGLIAIRDRVDSLTQEYQKAQKKYNNALSRIDITNYTESFAIQTRAIISDIADDMDKYAIMWCKENIRFAYNVAKRDRIKLLKKIGYKKELKSDAPHGAAIKKGTARAIYYFTACNDAMVTTANTYLDLLKKAHKALKNAKIQEFSEAEISAGITKLIAADIAKGISINRIQKALIEQFKAWFGDFDYIVINDRRYELKYYARLVARTESRRIQSEATVQTAKQYGDDLVIFSTHDSPCPICAPLEGQVFSISGNNKKYDQLTSENTPPIHCNCEHGIDPTSQFLLDRA